MSNTENQVTGVHRWPLLGALSVVVFTLIIVTLSVIFSDDKTKGISGAQKISQVQHRNLHFRDAPNGEVVVYDADTSKPIGRFGKGKGAFVRISMRSMVSQRISKQISLTEPYSLIEYSDGNMRILDPIGGDSIRINAFGAVAINDFKRILSTGIADPNHSAQGAEG